MLAGKLPTRPVCLRFSKRAPHLLPHDITEILANRAIEILGRQTRDSKMIIPTMM